MDDRCPFCALEDRVLVYESDLVVGFRDAYPVSPGHTLLITRRHARDFFETTEEEGRALWAGVNQVTDELRRTSAPDGFNVGFNAGRAAGQTVMHVHVHVIPRFDGDLADPRGGVRGVIPSKRIYGCDG